MRRHRPSRGRGSLRALSIGLTLLATPALADEPTPFRLDEFLDTPDWLKISGSHRIRYSTIGNQFRANRDQADEALGFRTLLKAEATFGKIGFVGELQDSRMLLTDENSGAGTANVNALEMLQGYMQINLDGALAGDDKLDLFIGRQTFDLGSRRLIARNRHRNAIQAFTGIRSLWTDGGNSELTTFFLLPVRTKPSDREDILENRIEFDEEDFDLRLWGFHYKHSNLALGATGEIYLFGLNEDDDPNELEIRDRELFTPGTRLVRAPKAGNWDFDIENVLQFGSRRASTNPLDETDLDVFAHFHHVALGYTWDVAWSPRLDFEFDFASGEPSTTDDDANRFDTLFGPRRSDFGPTDLFGILGRENLISPGLRISAKPNGRTTGFISWRANWLDEKTDSFARSGVRDATGQSGSFGGHQIEGRVRHWLVPGNVRLEIGGAWFVEGDFLKTAPAASGNGDPVFVYTDLAFTF